MKPHEQMSACKNRFVAITGRASTLVMIYDVHITNVSRYLILIVFVSNKQPLWIAIVKL